MTDKWLIVLISALCIVMLPAFGIEVGISQRSSDQGCETTNSCYIPHSISVDVGQQVTWSNNDSAAHTVTSGTDTEGPDRKFDSGIIMQGKSFSYKFETLGEFPYYCMVHPWMEGIIAVGADIYEKARLERQSYAPEITIKTELPLYDHGDSVVFSGLVKDLDKSNAPDLKIRVIGPLVNGQSSNIVTVKQILLYRNGSFEGFFTASGPLWQDKGVYKIVAEHGALRAETKFFYNGGTETTDDATVLVSISAHPSKLQIDFLNPRTNSIQEHVDYTVLIKKDGRTVFGPNPVIHTSLGSIDMPFQFMENEEYEITVDIVGILFKPIPEQTVTFTGVVAEPDLTENPSDVQPITVSTDEDHYSDGDVIMIYGEVGEKLVGFPVQLQIIATNGNLVTYQSLDVSEENTYRADITAGGTLWRSAGTYTVKVIYGTETRSAKTTFEFGGSGNGTDNSPSNMEDDKSLKEKLRNLQISLAEVKKENQNLKKLNAELQDQVEALQKKVDDLNAIISEQIKVIYQWVISR